MRFLNLFLLILSVAIAGCESREEARRKQAVNNLKQIGLALQNYHAANAESGGTKNTNDQAPETAVPKAEDAGERAEKPKKVTGEIAEFHRNPEGDIDGITLKDGTEVRFPPKSGEKVSGIVSIGDKVEISGWTQAGESEVHAATITNTESGKFVEVDQLPPDLPE